MKYVIIGNSAAAVGAVEGIRKHDRTGEITIISDEPQHTYSRPLISYLLRGDVAAESMRYRPKSFYADNACTVRLGMRAVAIDATAKYVLLADGERVAYDKLLVATGSAPSNPTFEGLDTVKSRHTFMSCDDAVRLGEAINEASRVLIIGSGLIGLKCAEGIAARVASVTVAARAPSILTRILDAHGASRIQAHIEDCGIIVKTNCNITRFDDNTAYADNGEKIAFDVLVTAVGVRPNVELLQGIAAIERGVLVNAKSETTAADIYAAGDCTQTRDVVSGDSRTMALLPNAYMQGEVAGVNMATSNPANAESERGNAEFNTAMMMNAVGFFGLHVITAGNYNGATIAMENESSYRRFFYSENRLIGFILIGDVEKAGIYTTLIRKRTPLDSIDFALVCEKPGLMAFTRADRAAVLGGAV